jgi:hypothetical protein
MTQMLPVVGAALLAFGLTGMGSYKPREPQQVECHLNGGFIVELQFLSDDGRRTDNRPYVLTFDYDGPGFLLPDAKYVPDWTDVEVVVFRYAPGRQTGHLSMNLHQHGRSFVQRVGILKHDCWDLGKQWLTQNQPKIPIVESVEPQK